MTHLLKLLDKMCIYEMDLASIVEDTERTRFCPQTDGQMDRRMDNMKPIYPLSTLLKWGVIMIMQDELSKSVKTIVEL